MTVFKIGAFAIILDDRQRVLLCHRRDHDLWNLPGGMMESGESPWDTVLREVREEVGVNVTIERLAGIYSRPEQDEIVFSFVCRIAAGTPTATEEADQIGYFAMQDLPRNTSHHQVERIRDAVNAGAELTLKTQFGPSSLELLRRGKV